MKKRFGLINMSISKEVEETIINDGEQINKLYEKIDNYKKIIEERDEEINLLKEQNKIYKEIISKKDKKINNKNNYKKLNEYHINTFLEDFNYINNNIIDDYENVDVIVKNKIFNIPFIPAHKMLEKENKENKFNKFGSNISKDNIKIKTLPPKVTLNKCLFDYYNNIRIITKRYIYPFQLLIKFKFVQYYNIEHYGFNNKLIEYNYLPHSPPDTPKNKRKNVKKDNVGDADSRQFKLFKKTPINKFVGIDNNEVFKLIAGEYASDVRYQNLINSKIRNDKQMLEASDFYTQNDINLREKSLEKRKQRFQRKLSRCTELHEEFGEKLNIFEFNISGVTDMAIIDWPVWKNELKNKIDAEYGDIPICKDRYKKGKLKGMMCGKMECKLKSHI